MNWQTWQQQYVKANYTALPVDVIAAHVNRTRAAVQKKAHELGVYKSKGFIPPGKKHWGRFEENVLKVLYSTRTSAQIGQLLGRSDKSVMAHAHLLGLSQKGKYAAAKEWTAAEDNVLRAEYGKTEPKLLAQRMGRTRFSVLKRAFRLGLTKKTDHSTAPAPARKTERLSQPILPPRRHRQNIAALPSRPAINPGDVSVTLRPGFTVFCPPGQSVEEVRAKYAKYL